jgi:ketosteroid isomerase-like protein
VAVRHVNAVERVIGLSNRCAAGDAAALVELETAYHDDARFESLLPEARDLQSGAAAVREYFERVVPTYEEWQIVLDYVQDYGDTVLALGALRAVPPGGADLERAVGWIFTFRDEKIDAVTAYPSYGDALRAATMRHVKTP